MRKSLPLRITLNGTDYTYSVQSKLPLPKETDELELLVEGELVKLVRADRGWQPKEEDPTGLIPAIAKVVSSRYPL